MHKMVNGVRIECTPEEEAEIKADWERGRIRQEERQRLKQEQDLKKAEIKEKAASNLGISIEELKLILGKSR